MLGTGDSNIAIPLLSFVIERYVFDTMLAHVDIQRGQFKNGKGDIKTLLEGLLLYRRFLPCSYL